MTKAKKWHLRDGVAASVSLFLLAAALIQELRKPASERHWVGKVAGVVPYDLRKPNLRRVVASVWSPDDPRILMPYAYGVGWTINVGRLVRILRERTSRVDGSQELEGSYLAVAGSESH
jgi:hypothetical protein